ncbi:MAG: hypothetical protein WB990_07635 [Candidatus Acidiferrales bacterium]
MKVLVLGKLRSGPRKGQQTIYLKSAISVREEQHLTFRNLDAPVSRGRNPGMRLPEDRERIAFAPAADRFGDSLAASIVHDDHFKIYFIFLLVQRSKAFIEGRPIFVDGYDDAK